MSFDPSNFIPVLGRMYPWIYTRLDELRKSEGVVSLNDVQRLLMEDYGLEIHSAALMAPVVTACTAWKSFRRTYDYHGILARFLVVAAEGLNADTVIPLDTLRYLPVPCFYVQAPNVLSDGFDGFFVWVDEGDSLDPLLRLVFVMGNGCFFPYSYVQLKADTPIGGCLPDALTITAPVIREAVLGCEGACGLLSGIPAVPGKFPNVIHNLTVRALQLLFYLVSAEADIEESKTVGEDTSVVRVGPKAGDRLEHIAKLKKTHIRQGHWHRYWIGPKNGDRRQIMKWIEPCVVGEGYLKSSVVSVVYEGGDQYCGASPYL